MILALRVLTVAAIIGQALDLVTFLWAASALDIDLSQEGEQNPIVRWIWGNYGVAGVVAAKVLTVSWLLAMVRVTMMSRARVLALVVLLVGAGLGFIGAGFNAFAVIVYGGKI